MKQLKRTSLAIYLYYNRDVRKLRKYGNIIYHSRRMRYVILYLDESLADEVIDELQRLKFVKAVKPSALEQIDQSFVGNLADIAKETKDKLSDEDTVTLLN